MTNRTILKKLDTLTERVHKTNRTLEGDFVEPVHLEQALRYLVTIDRLTEETKLLIVKALRERGRSWADVGSALGISREAAWQRYRDLDPA